jgi:hypothetical protein
MMLTMRGMIVWVLANNTLCFHFACWSKCVARSHHTTLLYACNHSTSCDHRPCVDIGHAEFGSKENVPGMLWLSFA